jgi:hypothetical protein
MENTEEDRLLRGKEPSESVARFMLAYCSSIYLAPVSPWCGVYPVADFVSLSREDNGNEIWFSTCMQLPRVLVGRPIGPTFLVYLLDRKPY